MVIVGNDEDPVDEAVARASICAGEGVAETATTETANAKVLAAFMMLVSAWLAEILSKEIDEDQRRYAEQHPRESTR